MRCKPPDGALCSVTMPADRLIYPYLTHLCNYNAIVGGSGAHHSYWLTPISGGLSLTIH